MKNALLALILLIPSYSAIAQDKPNAGIENLYRGVKTNDLITFLPPRLGQDSLLNNNNEDGFFSRDNGCPNEILIGSVAEDSGIRGSVDIDVVIDSDITIVCGGL
ncbi:MAG: hypothetical protein GW903_06445 [Alphaproteobacteria bacterium]|nr:hypothetical protein [Alphaproteobacteria bacterium]NCQ88520.1 hypothetical protein [Alphaproteobacteria bacterium]NCT06063.1 hypothetical protein [Alphaproteobacteria bacterium]